MTKYAPEILSPTPEPWFIRELRLIDPELRVVWGMERYLRAEWAIERRMSPERYFTAYEAVLSSDGPRFVDQPIFDHSKPIFDEEGTGEIIGYEQVGVRKYDLAPEFEWMTFAKELNSAVILELKRAYAYNINHPYSRERFEAEQREEAEKKKEAFRQRRIAAGMEGVEEAFREARKQVVFGHGATRNE